MKKTILILSLIWFSIAIIKAQVNHSITYLDNVGNPDELNTLNDNAYHTADWQTLTATTIKWTVNDVVQTPVNWTENLLQNVNLDISNIYIPPPNNPNNIGLSSFVDTLYGAGNQNVSVRLFNNGLDTLTSTIINWEVNGVAQTPMNWTGNLFPTDTQNVNLGIFNFNIDSNYHIVSWVEDTTSLNYLDNAIQLYFCTSLNGHYTIGGSAAHFNTLQEALSRLESCGIMGAVTFTLNAGVYEGPFSIGEVVGTNATNTITIDGVNATDVMLRDTLNQGSTTYLNTMFLIHGADYLTIKNISAEVIAELQNTSDYIGYCFSVTNESRYFTFENNKIHWKNPLGGFAPSLSGASGIFNFDKDIYSSFGDHIVIQNNELLGSDIALNFIGGETETPNIKIEQNQLLHCREGIYLFNQDSVWITDNVMDGRIYADKTDGLWVNKNRINGAEGMNLDRQVTDYQIINNAINTVDYGITIARDGDVWHNTVHVKKGPAFIEGSFLPTPNLDVRNNIFISDSSILIGIILNIETGAVFENNIYVKNDSFDLVHRYSPIFDSHIENMAEWRLYMGHINNQYIETYDTSFINLTTLKPNYGIALNNGASSLGVLEDVIGVVRPQLGGFDIGAYEYEPLSFDAGITGILSPDVPMINGNQPVKIELQNAGLIPLTSATINWKINDTLQTPFIWSGNLMTADLDTVIIGTYNFQTPFVSIEAWFSDVNGQGSDTNALNDTTKLETCDGMSGIYTIGNNNADFLNFGDVLLALNSCGAADTVIFYLQPGIYNDPLIIEEIVGAAANRPIIFDGMDTSLVTIENTTDSIILHSIYLNGADHIILRNLTIRSTGTENLGALNPITQKPEFSTCLYLHNNANFNTVENCLILPRDKATGIAGIENNFFPEPYGHNLTIRNNHFNHDSYYLIYLLGNNDNELTQNLTIENNIIEFGANLYPFVELGNQENLTFSHNKIRSKNSNNWGSAVYMNQLKKANIIGNEIITGLQTPMIIQQDPYFPIASDTINIINNIINRFSTDSITPYWHDQEALSLERLTHVNLWHNTIISQYYKGISIDRTESMDMRNNIIYSGRFNNFAMQIDTTDIDLANYRMDYNNFYSAGAPLILINSGTITSLSDFQTNFPQWNMNSIGAKPTLRSLKNSRLLIGPGVDVGDTTLNILEDIDGDPRPIGGIVDIGADEYLPLNNDLGIVGIIGANDQLCGDTATMIELVVRNFGINTFANATIKMEVTGNTTNIFTASLSNLSVTDFDTISFGPLDTYYGEIHQFKVFLENNIDDDIENDTLEQDVYFIPSMTLNTTDVTICLSAPTDSAVANYPTGRMGNGYVWFDNVKDVTPVLGRDSTLSAPTLLNDAVYHVVGTVDTTSIGLPNLNGGTVATRTNTLYMNLMVKQPLTVDTITIYPDLASTIIIRIIKGPSFNGTEYVEIMRPIAPNEVGTAVKVPINVYLAEGQYLVRLRAGIPFRLFTHTSGVARKYDIPNVLTMENKGSNAAYSYFYDWKITKLGCDAQPVNFFINDLQLSNITVNSVTCFGEANGEIDVTVDGSLPPYTFNWSNNDTSEDITNLVAGTYQLTFTDASGCVGLSGSPIIVSEPSALITNVNIEDVSCFNGTNGSLQAAVTGGVGNYTFNWSNDSTNSSINNLNSGNYELTVTDGNNCTDTTFYIINEPTPLIIDEFTIALDTGILGLGMATAVVSGGTPNYTYQWDSAANYQTTATAVGLNNGFYLVSVTDANGCTTSDTAFIFTVSNDKILGVSNFQIYPNPTTNYVNIELELEKMLDVQIDILDATGRLIKQFHRSNIQQLTEALPLNNMGSGIYLIKIRAGNIILNQRLMISN